MKKILTVVGARPQFVKAAAVSRAIREIGGIDEYLLHTGQHYDRNMSEAFFDQLGLPKPNRNLGIGSGSHGAQTGRMLEALEAVMREERPHWVLVYGDTNSTLAGALAATKLHIPVAHVEAGLRSFNRRMPEEVNRVLTDHASDLLFVPTRVAVGNLAREGIEGPRVHLVGDVMLDAVRHYCGQSDGTAIRAGLGLESGRYILATIHRQENTDRSDRLRAILDGLEAVARDIPVILPMHPRTRAAVDRLRAGSPSASAMRLLEPVDYLTMLALEQGASLIVTDSGGVQKEAFFFGVPCLTVRDETEWTELIEIGWNELCPPTSAEQLAVSVRRRLDWTPAERPALYGTGDAASKIVHILSDGHA